MLLTFRHKRNSVNHAPRWGQSSEGSPESIDVVLTTTLHSAVDNTNPIIAPLPLIDPATCGVRGC